MDGVPCVFLWEVVVQEREKDPENHLFLTTAVENVKDIQNIPYTTYTAASCIPSLASHVSCCCLAHEFQCPLPPIHSASFAHSVTFEGISLIS